MNLDKAEHELNRINLEISISDGSNIDILLKELNKILCDVIYTRRGYDRKQKSYLLDYCKVIKIKGFEKRKAVK